MTSSRIGGVLQVLNERREVIAEFNHVARLPDDELARESKSKSHARWVDENRDYVKSYQRGHEAQSEASSSALAHRQGVSWSGDDDVFLMADDGRSLYQKAVGLGRSWRACKARRAFLVRRGEK